MKLIGFVTATLLSYVGISFVVDSRNVAAVSLPSFYEHATPLLGSWLPQVKFDTAALGQKAAATVREAINLPTSSNVASDQVMYLIRSTLLALDDANRTGNYSVLRDLATPDLQHRHSLNNLAAIFAAHRRRGVDLAPSALLTPKVSVTTSPAPQRALRIVGSFATVPSVIDFDLHFRPVAGQWRLEGLIIDVADAP
jgi:hypothetical protein